MSRIRSITRRLRNRFEMLRDDNVRLAKENVRLKRALSKELDLSVESPAFEGGLGGRTAVQHYRNVNVGKFIQHMNEAGGFALARGPDAAAFFIGTVVKADLECLFAAAPSTEEEGQRRAICEWKLTAPEVLEVLAGTADWSERARRNFISEVLSAGVDTSTQELVRRSGEMPQQQALRPDED